MKLYLNNASPYARLIRVLLIETGLDGATELVFVDPWTSPPDLLAANPAAKIPTLVLDDGTALIESSCIADYLVRLSGQTVLTPPPTADQGARLRILGLGRAATDCAFGAVIQQRFAPQSPLIDRWLSAVPGIAAALNKQLSTCPPGDGIDQGDLTMAVAFEYVDFRLPDVPWKSVAPHLIERVRFVGQRPALASTAPTANNSDGNQSRKIASKQS